MTTKKLSDYGVKQTYFFSDIDGETRLRELILYIADRCFDDPTFGAVKLNKILFFADFSSFAQYGKPITGVEYMRLPEGPVPRRMMPVLSSLEDDSQIYIRYQTYYLYEQKRVIPLRQANINIFGPTDISLIDVYIRQLWGKTAKEVSALSHKTIAWSAVERDKTLIPYEAALLSHEGLTDEDLLKAEELISEYGWDV